MKWSASVLFALLLVVGAVSAWAECASGKKAASFVSPDFYTPSKNIASSQLYANKTTLISFFATWCRPCKEEIPELRALTERYADRGFQAVLISLDRDRRDVESFLKSANSGNLTVVWDPERKIKDLYSVSQLPTNVRIDPDGCVATSWFGYLPAKLHELETHLKTLPKLSPP